MRLIDADATIEFLAGFGNREYRSEKGTIREAIKALKYAEYTPTVDAEPVRHGHWKSCRFSDSGLYQEQCSVCGGWSHDVRDYCPNCGAKMDEVNDV